MSRNSRAPNEGHLIADCWIGRDAAPELRRRRLVFADFADQLQLRHRGGAGIARERLRTQPDVRDQSDKERFAGAHAEEFADGCPRLLRSLRRRPGEPDARLRAAHGDHPAENLNLLHRTQTRA